MTDPQNLHQAEQAIAAFSLMAAGLAKAYKELCEGGVPPEYAIRIVVQMAQNLGQPQPPR